MQWTGFGTMVGDGNAPENVFRGALGHLLQHVEVASFVEQTHVGKFQLRSEPTNFLVLNAQRRVRILALRVFIKCFGVGVCWRGIQIIVTFLHVLPMVAFITVQAKKALFEDGVAAIPKCWSKTHATLPVCPALQTVLPPTVRPSSRVVVREGVPAVTMVGIIFTHGPPLPFAEEGAPALPTRDANSCLGESFDFPIHPLRCIRAFIWRVSQPLSRT